MLAPILAFDPVTLTAIGLGVSALGSIGGAAAGLANRPKAPAVPNTPPTPTPIQQPTANAAPTSAAGQPSFLAAAAAPQSGQAPGKTLLGQ